MSTDLITQTIRSIRNIDQRRVSQFLKEYLTHLKNMHRYFNKEGQLVYLDRGEALILGDIHGDISTLAFLLEKADIKQHIANGGIIVCLGDYIDRGKYQVETILFLITLQMRYKKNILLLRGNHEPPEWLLPYPHDFPLHLRSRFPELWRDIYNLFMQIFDELPTTAVSKSGILMLHGGISVKNLLLENYKRPDREMLTEILWNDPMNEDGYRPSYRGAGYLFGPDITAKFLDKNNLELIVRGHEPANGYQYRHNGKIITLFSRTGPPYMNTMAAAVKIALEERYRKGSEEIITITDDEVRESLS